MNRWIKRCLTGTVLTVAAATAAPTAASAAEAVWLLRNANSPGYADTAFVYGSTGLYFLAGDWNGDGIDTPAGTVVNGAGSLEWHFRNSNANGGGEFANAFGTNGDHPVPGDWDGNGTDTQGAIRHDNGGRRWWLNNALGNQYVPYTFTYGLWVGDIPISGDWDGNGTDTPGIYRIGESRFYLSNDFSGGTWTSFQYGDPNSGVSPLVGDWDGNGTDTIGLYNPANSQFMLRNANNSGAATWQFTYGDPGSFPITGDWDGNGTDTIGVIRTDGTPPPPVYAWSVQCDSNVTGWADLPSELECLRGLVGASGYNNGALWGKIDPRDIERVYATSWVHGNSGGASHVIDTAAEKETVANIIASADDDSWSGLWSGLSPDDQDRVYDHAGQQGPPVGATDDGPDPNGPDDIATAAVSRKVGPLYFVFHWTNFDVYTSRQVSEWMYDKMYYGAAGTVAITETLCASLPDARVKAGCKVLVAAKAADFYTAIRDAHNRGHCVMFKLPYDAIVRGGPTRVSVTSSGGRFCKPT